MTTIEKIEQEYYDFSEFSEDQINFIKALVKLSFNEGVEEGKNECE